MFGPSSGTSGYMDKSSGEGFHAWKLKMTFLSRRDQSWGLMNGDESMPKAPTIGSKEILKRERLELMLLLIENNQFEEKGSINTFCYCPLSHR
jgi:hypothetical protein